MSENGIFTRIAITPLEGDEIPKIRSFYFYQNPAILSACVQVTELKLHEHEEYIDLWDVRGEGLAMDANGWIFPAAFRFVLVPEDQAGALRVTLELGKHFMMSGAFSAFDARNITILNPEFTPASDEVRKHFERAVQVNYLA